MKRFVSVTPAAVFAVAAMIVLAVPGGSCRAGPLLGLTFATGGPSVSGANVGTLRASSIHVRASANVISKTSTSPLDSAARAMAALIGSGTAHASRLCSCRNCRDGCRACRRRTDSAGS